MRVHGKEPPMPLHAPHSHRTLLGKRLARLLRLEPQGSQGSFRVVEPSLRVGNEEVDSSLASTARNRRAAHVLHAKKWGAREDPLDERGRGERGRGIVRVEGRLVSDVLPDAFGRFRHGGGQGLGTVTGPIEKVHRNLQGLSSSAGWLFQNGNATSSGP